MKSIQKLLTAFATSCLDGMVKPDAFVVSVSQAAINKLLVIIDAGCFDYSDTIYIDIGQLKPVNAEGEQIRDLDWRPTNAQIRVHGKLDRNELCRSMRVTVGSQDGDGEFMWGELQLTEEELAYLLDDGSDEEGEFNVYAVTTITRQGLVVQGTKKQILERCNDHADLQGELIYAKEEYSDTTFHVDRAPSNAETTIGGEV